MEIEDLLQKQRSLYQKLSAKQSPLATHPVSGKWQNSNHLINQYWWGGGASQEAFTQLNQAKNPALNQIGVISFGPVQSFLGSGQRLRDWAVASWLCHYLTAVLIFRWEEQGGKILLPLYQKSPLVKWLKGQSDINSQEFWRPELPNVVTGLFPGESGWIENCQEIVKTEWTRLVTTLETAATDYNHRLNGIGWRVIHRDHQHLWSVYSSAKPLQPEHLIEDIHSLHVSLEAQKVGRVWEYSWWGGYTSPSAGNLSIWHPGLKPVTNNGGGTWGLPRHTLNQWWEELANQKNNRLFSENDRLNSLELIKRLASIPEIIESSLKQLWNLKPPTCPWKNFPEETAIAASWIKDVLKPEDWNQEIEFLNGYFLGDDSPTIWGMPTIDSIKPQYIHPRVLERRNIEKEQKEDWDEYTQPLSRWASTIEWRVGWRGDGDKLGEWLAGKQYQKKGLAWSQWHPTPEMIEEYQLELNPVNLSPQEYRQIELPHILDISILLNYWSRLLYPLTEEHHNSKVIFAGGDDFLLLGPITEAISLTTDLYKLWSGESTPLTQPLNPPMDGWVKHQQQVYPIPGKTMTFSLGVVIAQRRIPQSLWHRSLNEAYHLAKSSGRDRVCIQILFNSGQSLNWVCPWILWELLMTLESQQQDKTELNIWEKLLFYIESTRITHNSIRDVPDLIETLWKSVGLSLTWQQIEEKITKLRDYESEIGNWDWWLNWISLRAFLTRQHRERNKWTEEVSRR